MVGFSKLYLKKEKIASQGSLVDNAYYQTNGLICECTNKIIIPVLSTKWYEIKKVLESYTLR